MRANASERRIGPRYKLYHMSSRSNRSAQAPAGGGADKGDRPNRRRVGSPIKVASGARAAAAVALVLENMLVDPFGSLNYFQKFRHHGYPVCEDT